MLRFFRFALLSCLISVTACHRDAAKPPIPVPEVVVEAVQVRDIQPYISATGLTEAYEFVQVPARVSGFLREVRYTPGDIVEAGAPLFLIEPEQYAAEVKSAQALLASAQAQLKLSEANLARTRTLITQGAMTEQDLQTDEAKRDEAAAAVMRAEAQSATAQLNLSYTDVRSPITGKTDRNLVDVGNLVSPHGEHGILTTVAGMDPIYVYFDISDYGFNRIRSFAKEKQDPEILQLIERLKTLKENRGKKPGTEPESKPTPPPAERDRTTGNNSEGALESLDVGFEISLIKGASPNTSEYPFKGIIDMTANKIDESTGTIKVRGEIPNEDYTIFPGQICRVRIPVWPIPDAILVKQEAIGTDLNQRYVFVVDDRNVAHRRVVELGDAQSDGTRVVKPAEYRENLKTGEKVVVKGLEKNERYVVSGIQKVRDGGEVKIVEPTFSTRETARNRLKEKEESREEEKRAEPDKEPLSNKTDQNIPAPSVGAGSESSSTPAPR